MQMSLPGFTPRGMNRRVAAIRAAVPAIVACSVQVGYMFSMHLVNFLSKAGVAISSLRYPFGLNTDSLMSRKST